MTPDWAAKPTTVPYAKFGDPQSLNLYSFVENSPIDRFDPDGHMTSGDFKCNVGRHCQGDGPQTGDSCDNTAGDCYTGDWSHDYGFWLGTSEGAEWLAEQSTELSKKSEAAIEHSALTGEQAGAFESAAKATGSADGINPNALVGIRD